MGIAEVVQTHDPRFHFIGRIKALNWLGGLQELGELGNGPMPDIVIFGQLRLRCRQSFSLPQHGHIWRATLARRTF